ncbi:MAG: class I SAM-dependent methyltransferase [Alphaproteobacteria bacterium]|nr:class I SAM-dependent methyltransferase [Alphaproteobacteria bacterium]
MAVRDLLEFSPVYRAYQSALGISKQLGILVRDYIRPEPGMRILDIGCGPGTVFGYLPPGLHYEGLDPTLSYIEQARRAFGDRGLFHHGGVEELTQLVEGPFDLVISLGVLHHLPDSLGGLLARQASGLLKPGGRLLTIDPTLVPEQARISRFLVENDRGEHVRPPEGYKALIAPWFAEVDQTIRHDLLHIPYTEVICEARGPKAGEAEA